MRKLLGMLAVILGKVDSRLCGNDDFGSGGHTRTTSFLRRRESILKAFRIFPITLCLLISACGLDDHPAGVCVGPDAGLEKVSDAANLNNSSSNNHIQKFSRIVKPDGTLHKTNISINGNVTLPVSTVFQTSGAIELCNNGATYDTKSYINRNSWKKTNISLPQTGTYSIKLVDPDAKYESWSKTASGAVTCFDKTDSNFDIKRELWPGHPNCISEKGQGLLIYIGGDNPNNKWDDWIKDVRQQEYLLKRPTSLPPDGSIFLYHAYSENNPSGVLVNNAIVPGNGGDLWIRYVDLDHITDANNFTDDEDYLREWNQNNQNNQGGYEIIVKTDQSSLCRGVSGQFLEAYIGYERTTTSPYNSCTSSFVNNFCITDTYNLDNCAYYVAGNTVNTDCYSTNARFRQNGRFNNEIPYKGKLAFRIKEVDSAAQTAYNAYRTYVNYCNSCNTRIGVDRRACFNYCNNPNNAVAQVPNPGSLESIDGCIASNCIAGSAGFADCERVCREIGNVDGTDNTGEYVVDIAIKQDNFLDDIIGGVIDPVRKTLMGTETTTGVLEVAYKGITANGLFIAAVEVILAISLTAFALGYILGFASMPHEDIIKYMIKIVLVMTIISPNSWEFFYQYFFTFFVEGTDTLILLMSGFANSPDTIELSNTDSVFNFLNDTMRQIFAVETQVKLLGLLLSPPMGTIYAVLIYVGIFYFLMAILKAVILYLTVIIVVGFLLLLAPIFFLFLLFNQTKDLFEKWVKMLMSFALQPILLFTMLAIFNALILSVLHQVLNFSVCWLCAWEINWYEVGIDPAEILGKTCIYHSYKVWGDVSSYISLAFVLIFILMSSLMLKFTGWVVDIANSLTAGGVTASTAVAQARGAVIGAASTALKSGKQALGIAKQAGGVAKKGLTKPREAIRQQPKKED